MIKQRYICSHCGACASNYRWTIKLIKGCSDCGHTHRHLIDFDTMVGFHNFQAGYGTQDGFSNVTQSARIDSP